MRLLTALDRRRATPGPNRWRFVGTITGVGTSSGTRLVVGAWRQSPYGKFADVMVEHRDGHRVLLAPTAEVAHFVSTTYAFDEVLVVPLEVRNTADEIAVDAGPLCLRATVGPRTLLGWLLRGVPPSLATDLRWLRLLAPIASRLLPGVRTAGSAGSGRREYYGATDVRRVTALTASWSGTDLGPLADVTPPTRFGFSSAPRRPASVAVTTTVEET